MKPISRFAAAAAVSGGLALAGLGLAGAAAADYYWFNWCPGETPPSAASNRNLDWDWNVCHQYRYQGNDLIDESGRLYPAPPPPPARSAVRTCSPADPSTAAVDRCATPQVAASHNDVAGWPVVIR